MKPPAASRPYTTNLLTVKMSVGTVLGPAAAGVGVVTDDAFMGGEDAVYRIVGDREGFD